MINGDDNGDVGDQGGAAAAAADDDDVRCGPEFPLDDGLPSECDGSSFFPCCSK